MQMHNETMTAEEYAARIFDICGHKIDPPLAEDLWNSILQHKWVLSEKTGRDVGVKVACIDFIENILPDDQTSQDDMKFQQLKRMGAQMLDKAAWETISDSQPPKQVVEKRIVLPLMRTDLADKHGVSPPRSIIFFGPPGTGKTHFARAIAARLQWWYVEVSPSSLMLDGEDRMGGKLKQLFETTRDFDELVLFIDEFEEIAGSRDQATRTEKSITNEFLKQVPLFRREKRQNILVCATNYIRQLDAALLRPGRFDCVIPVGDLDHASRSLIFQHYLASTNNGTVDVDRVVSELSLYTPADIEYLFDKVSHFAFEKEYHLGSDYRITTDTFLEIIAGIPPSLSEADIVELEEDNASFTRY